MYTAVKVICYLGFFSLTAIAGPKDLLSFLQPIQHEVRFTKFEGTINESYGKVIEAGYKQYYGKQVLNAAMTYHKKAIIYVMNLEVTKCKEHFIDCVNVRTFDVTHLCGNEKVMRYFYTADYQNRDFTCELYGEYFVKNMTYNFDQAIPLFFNPTEKWWELSFKWKISFFTESNYFIMKFIGENEMITFRRRGGKPKTP